MKEIIEAQFKSGKSLTKAKYHHYINKRDWPKFIWELYPIAEEYYHELNPYFLFNYYKDHLIKFSKTTVVRDGYLSLISFILRNYQSLSKLEAGLFFIDPDLAPLIPSHISYFFGSWSIVHKNYTPIEQADRVVIFGLLSDEYLGNLEILKQKLEVINKVPLESSIDILLPLRRNLFVKENKEDTLAQEVIALIQSLLKSRNYKFILTKDLMESTTLNGTYLLDLNADKMLVSDNYLDHYVISKGGTSSNITHTTVPHDSLFSIELSLHHDLHLRPLPQVKSFFPEIIFHKKFYHVQDYLYDQGLKTLLRDYFLNFKK